jgi:nucleotide-binding universal stress UspA family protein
MMYAKILVPVDGSPASAAGLTEAIKIAKSQGSEIRLMHVVNDLILDYGYGSGVYGSDALEVLRTAGRTILDAAEGTVRREGIKTNSVLLESCGERASDLILSEAQAWSADVIVMGTHGRRGVARIVMGSDAESVVRACSIPVMLVRGPAKERAVSLRVAASAA